MPQLCIHIAVYAMCSYATLHHGALCCAMLCYVVHIHRAFNHILSLRNLVCYVDILLVLCSYELLDMQILKDFKLPEGAFREDIEADGDGEVLVVLNFRTDDSLVEAGLAREVVNRVQKLRKKAGLVASDIVDVYLNAQQHSDGKPGTNRLGPLQLH